MVDTGCEVSVIPKSFVDKVDKSFPPYSRSIKGIGNGHMYAIGSSTFKLHLGDLPLINHEFWVVKGQTLFGIVGIDFLRSNKLTIDLIDLKLIDNISSKTAQLFYPNDLPVSIVKAVNCAAKTLTDNYRELETRCLDLVSQFPELTKTPDYNTPPKHNHTLEIVLNDYKPRVIRARKLNRLRQLEVDKQYAEQVKRGALVRANLESGMSVSPITCVKKKDDSLRICVDYTYINSYTEPLSYPLPRIDSIPERIPGGTRFFSNLDLKEAFRSLPLHPDSQRHAAIITLSGVFVPLRTPFGLRNAPAGFQRFMEEILLPCRHFVMVYIDDILIFSKTENEHIDHLRQVLVILSKNGLYLNQEKSKFAKEKLLFLGNIVGTNGINVVDEKVKAIRDLPYPTTRKELKRFVGMVNHYNRWLPNIARTMAPLNALTGGPKSTNRTPIAMGAVEIKAYDDTIAELANATTLAFENHQKPLCLYTDASDTHVGAVLQQESEEGVMRPLAFFSKSLNLLQKSRSVFYKELRAIHLALKHFHHRIIGRELTIFSDSLSVVNAIQKGPTTQPPSEQRWLCVIREYNPRAEHVSGSVNVVADCLSRPPQVTAMFGYANHDSDYAYTSESEDESNSSENDSIEDIEENLVIDACDDVIINNNEFSTCDVAAIAELQTESPETIDSAEMYKKTVEYVGPEKMAVINEDGNRRVIVPESLRLSVFDSIHERFHLGIDKTIEKVAQNYWWPELNRDVSHWVRSCVTCQTTKVKRHNKPSIGFFPRETQRFQFVHLDLMGPLNVESGVFQYILTAKDRASGFLVTVPLVNKKASTVRDAFLQNWVGHLGVPQIVVSDNGREFVNTILTETFDKLGIDHRLVPPYTPQSNGFIERQHATINVYLRSLQKKDEWALHLPLLTANINNTLSEGSSFTPSQYTYGTGTNLSGRVLFNRIYNEDDLRPINDDNDTEIFLYNMSKISRSFQRRSSGDTYYEPNIFTCQYVWVKHHNRTKLEPLYHGPYKVHARHDQSFVICKNSRLVKENIRNLKAFVKREELYDKTSIDSPTNFQHDYNLRERKNDINYAEESSENDY